MYLKVKIPRKEYPEYFHWMNKLLTPKTLKRKNKKVAREIIKNALISNVTNIARPKLWKTRYDNDDDISYD